ncbi:MAG: PTS sugar transporter subunit IIC [Bacilli bacterium]|nr:PTS sugar transporter subunit IIC [Bacilli bacterium]
MEENNSTKTVETKKENKVLGFFITTLNGMAYGLFATLIIGTIIMTIGNFFPASGDGANEFTKFMNSILTNGAKALEFMTGAGIGVGVAIALKETPLKTIVLAGVGELAAYFSLSTKFVTAGVINAGAFQIGDPLTIYLVVISAALLMKLVLKKKTPVDIILVPLFGITVGLVAGLSFRFPAIYVTYAMQWLVNTSTNAVPFIMGIVVAVLMGMALTAPISSAAIGAMVFNIGALTVDEALLDSSTSGIVIASGAACVGCCVQMLGFAVMSRKDNPVGMVISIGIGTSMLQFKNILKKPLIWLPTIIVSAVLGPISTCWLRLACVGSSAGMGTSGLVGLIGLYSSMGNTWQTWVGMFGLCIALPIVLVWAVDLLFRKMNWIKPGDLSLNTDL